MPERVLIFAAISERFRGENSLRQLYDIPTSLGMAYFAVLKGFISILNKVCRGAYMLVRLPRYCSDSLSVPSVVGQCCYVMGAVEMRLGHK